MSFAGFKEKVPLSDYSTFRIGGTARHLFEASSSEELVQAVNFANSKSMPWMVIGGGSNILFPDEGIGKAIIAYRSRFLPVLVDRSHVKVSGGSSLFDFCCFAAGRGLKGLEKLTGIPGTVGGAIAGNAGAYGTSIGTSLSSVTLMDKLGNISEVAANDLQFSYRSSRIKRTGEVLLNATFKFENEDSYALMQIVEETLEDRRMKHPDPAINPTAGSFFQNPTIDGIRVAAGKLIEEAGCKCLKVGLARQWDTHANIIVAEAGAKAADVKSLTQILSSKVLAQFGITLVPEVVQL